THAGEAVEETRRGKVDTRRRELLLRHGREELPRRDLTSLLRRLALEQEDVATERGQVNRRRASCGTGADHDDVRCAAHAISWPRSSGKRTDRGGGGPQAYRPFCPSHVCGVHAASSGMTSRSL